MQLLLKFIFYIILILSVSIVPIIISILIYIKSNIRIAVKTLLILFFITISSCVYISNNPYIHIPDKYKNYVTLSEKECIEKYNSGLYSDNIPFIPIYIEIEYVDGDELKAKTQYFPFGFTEMSIVDGIPSLERNILGT